LTLWEERKLRAFENMVLRRIFGPRRNEVWVRRGGCMGPWWGNWREGDQWGNLGIAGWIILDGSPGGGMWVYGLD